MRYGMMIFIKKKFYDGLLSFIFYTTHHHLSFWIWINIIFIDAAQGDGNYVHFYSAITSRWKNLIFIRQGRVEETFCEIFLCCRRDFQETQKVDGYEEE